MSPLEQCARRKNLDFQRGPAHLSRWAVFSPCALVWKASPSTCYFVLLFTLHHSKALCPFLEGGARRHLGSREELLLDRGIPSNLKNHGDTVLHESFDAGCFLTVIHVDQHANISPILPSYTFNISPGLRHVLLGWIKKTMVDVVLTGHFLWPSWYLGQFSSERCHPANDGNRYRS